MRVFRALIRKSANVNSINNLINLCFKKTFIISKTFSLIFLVFLHFKATEAKQTIYECVMKMYLILSLFVSKLMFTEKHFWGEQRAINLGIWFNCLLNWTFGCRRRQLIKLFMFNLFGNFMWGILMTLWRKQTNDRSSQNRNHFVCISLDHI